MDGFADAPRFQGAGEPRGRIASAGLLGRGCDGVVAVDSNAFHGDVPPIAGEFPGVGLKGVPKPLGLGIWAGPLSPKLSVVSFGNVGVGNNAVGGAAASLALGGTAVIVSRRFVSFAAIVAHGAEFVVAPRSIGDEASRALGAKATRGRWATRCSDL